MSDTVPAAPSLQERVQSLRLGKDVRVPPRRGSKLFWLLILGTFVGGGAWIWLNYGEAIRKAFSTSTAPVASASVTAPSEREKIDKNIALEAGGYIVPFQKVQVSPKVGGQVKELFIEEGTYVKAGQVLAKLEVEEYLFEYRRAVATAELAKAKLEEVERGNREEEKLQAQAAELEAMESLSQAKDELAKLTASGAAITLDELDKAKSRVRIAEQKLEQQRAVNAMMKKGQRDERKLAAKAEYDQACAERDKAEWRLKNCEVVAPINGMILEKKTELGNTVRPEAFSNGLSANLCDMADLTKLEVEVDISERDVGQVWVNQDCDISTEAIKDRKYRGKVARIMPVASRSKASVTVRVQIENPNPEIEQNPKKIELRPEMRARVQFLKNPRSPSDSPPALANTGAAPAASKN